MASEPFDPRPQKPPTINHRPPLPGRHFRGVLWQHHPPNRDGAMGMILNPLYPNADECTRSSLPGMEITLISRSALSYGCCFCVWGCSGFSLDVFVVSFGELLYDRVVFVSYRVFHV